MVGDNMKRLITNNLIKWKNSDKRMPLIIHGARQIGKTYSMIDFAKSEYDDYVYINFESNPEFNDIFSFNLDPIRIIKEFSNAFQKEIKPHKTLIIFDEIQESSLALTSMKYFNEKAPDYHVIAAGSLLGVAVNKKRQSFPVGKVDEINMNSMSFLEFLMALGKDHLIKQIKEAYSTKTSMNASSHIDALKLHNDYMLIGGMPAVIKEYVTTNQITNARLIQQSIISNYLSDMSKYSDSMTTIKSRAIYNSLPSQLININRKFQYSKIKSGARSSAYELALDWIISSNIVHQCFRVTSGISPIEAIKEVDAFKIYFSDIGLFAAKSNYNPLVDINTLDMNSDFKGAFYENYVACELKQFNQQLYYYEIVNRSEVDFIVDISEGVIPIEVKASDNNKSKSLTTYIKKFEPKFSIRITAKNFGFENNIYSIPHYAIFTLNELLQK